MALHWFGDSRDYAVALEAAFKLADRKGVMVIVYRSKLTDLYGLAYTLPMHAERVASVWPSNTLGNRLDEVK